MGPGPGGRASTISYTTVNDNPVGFIAVVLTIKNLMKNLMKIFNFKDHIIFGII